MKYPQVHTLGPLLSAAALASMMVGGGCGSPSSSPEPFRGLDAAERYSAGSSGRRITEARGPAPVSIDGQAVEWAQLQSLMAEAAGALVIEELALEHALENEMTRRGMQLTDRDLANERAWLGLSMVESTGLAAEDALIQQVRRRRGLGPQRFAGLLRRNAMLRAMVRDRVTVSEEQLRLAWRVRHGERVRIRLITVPTEREAQSIAARAAAAEPASAKLRFAELAQTHSTDPSAARGGLVEAFSPEDPAYESTIRAAVAGLQPGQIGPVVAITNGFAVVYLEERLSADGVSLDAARPALTDQLRRRQERLLMDELATQLLAETDVRVLDESLNWSVRAGQER